MCSTGAARTVRTTSASSLGWATSVHATSFASRAAQSVGRGQTVRRHADVAEIGVAPWLVVACRALGIRNATPVQAACIPPALEGNDVIGAAETGTGKTLAFALPVVQHLAEDPRAFHTVVLTPTRELAFQIAHVFRALGAHVNLRDHVVVGGVHQMHQAAAMTRDRPHVLIATPGRLALLIEGGDLVLSQVRFLVLDEADRLLDPTYLSDLKTILGSCSSPKRQTLMFSATMTSTLEAVQAIAVNENAFRFDARENRFATVQALTQEYKFVPENLKDCELVHCLKKEFPKKNVIIFVSKCETAELLVTMLKLMGMKKVVALHSEMKQTSRIEALQKFKGSSVRALVATDLASRGLDIPLCELVINYDLPRKPSVYVHRVGRTARAGRKGLALTFVSQSDVQLVHAIEEKLQKKLVLHKYETEADPMDQLSLTLKARQIAKLALADNGFMQQVAARRADSRKIAKKRRKNIEKGKKADSGSALGRAAAKSEAVRANAAASSLHLDPERESKS